MWLYISHLSFWVYFRFLCTGLTLKSVPRGKIWLFSTSGSRILQSSDVSLNALKSGLRTLLCYTTILNQASEERPWPLNDFVPTLSLSRCFIVTFSDVEPHVAVLAVPTMIKVSQYDITIWHLPANHFIFKLSFWILVRHELNILVVKLCWSDAHWVFVTDSVNATFSIQNWCWDLFFICL